MSLHVTVRMLSSFDETKVSASLRVRIAPSPTGAIHLGLARTALFNWAYARGRSGEFLLRIEDTDRERSTAESERAILEGLSWLGLEWDEGPDVGGPHAPYRQSERVELHREAGEKLLAAGHAYRCFCSQERLEALREGQAAARQNPAYDGRCRDLDPSAVRTRAAAGEKSVLRFRVPPGRTRIEDLVRGDVSFDNSEVDDWIMLRQDGTPTYNFCVVVDDIAMRITHVLRGEEHLVNTPKQVLLYNAFGAPPPQFAHLPLMLGKDKKKLSKRSGDTSLDDYRRKGYPREAIANFLCLQGWALDGEHEIFSIDQLVRRFDIRDVNRAGAIFDPDKFLWMAGEYIRKDTVERLAERCAPFVIEAGLCGADELERAREWYLAVVALEQERIRLYSELPPRIAHYFAADDAVRYDPEAEAAVRKRGDGAAVLAAYLAWLRERSDLDQPASLSAATKAWLAERGWKVPALFQPLRCALTGLAGGPDLFEVIRLLGCERTLARMEAGIRRTGS